MYATTPGVQIGIYPDLWRKGRYRVDLSVELPFDPDDVDAALQQQGYHMVDTGQWGQSYSHNQDRTRTAELDEIEEQAAYVRLVLRNADLDEAGINVAENYLNSVYGGIYQVCQSRCDEYDYDPLVLSICPEVEQEAILALGHYKKGI